MPLRSYKSEFAKKNRYAMIHELRSSIDRYNLVALMTMGDVWKCASNVKVVLPREVDRARCPSCIQDYGRRRKCAYFLKTQDAGPSCTWVDTNVISLARWSEGGIGDGAWITLMNIFKGYLTGEDVHRIQVKEGKKAVSAVKFAQLVTMPTTTKLKKGI